MDRRYQKAGTEDFERAMEAESGRILDRFFERWIYGSSIPRVRYETQIGDKQVVVRFEQTGDQVFDIPVTVTLTYVDGRTVNVVVPVTDAQVERSIPTESPVRRVQVNQDSAALAEFVGRVGGRRASGYDRPVMETVSLTIDGRQVTVEKGKTVLQAAIEAGISVPYYCFHPGLTVDGSCRVCIVKIEKMPKLQTSCSTACTEGMVVTTRDPETTQARAGVLEFLLVNHPLDCPVCDKGGECPLQDFSYSFGPAESRMDFPRRVFDGEGVKADVDFGPTLMLNRNRCILCTRCVRFMREIDGDAQISIADRGNGSEIATFREEGVHSLLSGNLMDVCPVGAITTREYRFKSRPWDNPGVVDTTCTLCSKGCNTSAWQKAKPEWAKGSRLIRMTPRLNPAINGYWMCDIGRFDYHWVEGTTACAARWCGLALRSSPSPGMTSVRNCGTLFRRPVRLIPRPFGSWCPPTPLLRSCSSLGTW